MKDECWEWNGWKNQAGYSQKRVYGSPQYVHRLAWAWANGFWDETGIHIPEEMKVLHRCDNPACVNPDHLYLGTQADNARDMVDRGRHWQQKKTHCRNGHELTTDNIYTCRARGNNRLCRICRRVARLKYLAKIKP